MTLSVLLGGARSGKSTLAVRMAKARNAPTIFIATGAPIDDEMAARIARHRAERPPEWTTVEERVDLVAAIEQAPNGTSVIVDCLTLWLSNVLDKTDDDIEAHAAMAARAAARHDGVCIAVSNEVGSGIVPVDADVRRYRDLLGRANSLWAEEATAAWLVVAGRLLELRRAEGATDA